jgi:hypothetical protein
MFEGGPPRVVLKVLWYRVVGTCPIAKTKIVVDDPLHPLNDHTKHVFLDACYQEPVALFPHDPFGKSARLAGHYEIIDSNQLQSFD